MRRVIVYGMGAVFRENYDIMRSMERRGEFEIIAVTDKKVEQEYEYDGLRVIPPGLIPSLPFDYIYVVSRGYFSEIADDLMTV